MTTARLLKIQALSGLAFATFLLLHLVNTAAALAGRYDAFQRWARSLYHSVVFEIGCIVLALVVHVAVSLILARRRKSARPPLWLRLHRVSGYILTGIVFTHAFATRGVGLISRIPIAAEYVTFVLQAWPAYFYPYYALLLVAGAYHFTTGLRLASTRLGLPLSARLPPAFFHGLNALLVAAGMLGIAALGGTFRPAPVPDAPVYQRYFETFLPGALVTWQGPGATTVIPAARATRGSE